MDQSDRNAVISELARAIGAVARGDIDEGREIAGRVASILSPVQTGLPGIPVASTSVIDHKSTVARIFAYWQERCDHQTAKRSPERERAIKARLLDGFTEQEIRKGIDGAALAAFVNEDTGQKYDEIALICRNSTKLESFIARGVKETGEVVVDVNAASPLDEQISEVRRSMASLKKAGRDTEYEQQRVKLVALMTQRKEGKR